MMQAQISQYQQLAKQLVHEGRLAEARDQYQKICQLDDTSAEAWIMLGSLQGDLGEHEQAVSSLRKSIAIFPDNAATHYKLAGVLSRLGRHEESIDSLRRATQIEPGFAEAWYQLGLAHGRMGNASDAESAARRAIQIQPEMADAYVLLGNALCSLNRFDEATGHYKKALTYKPESLEANFKLGNALTVRGNPGEAIAFYRRSLELDPKFLEGYNRLGLALFKLKAYSESIEAYEKALSINNQIPGIYVNLANVFDAMGSLARAEACLRQAANLNPNLAVVHSNLGNTLKSQGRLQEALDCFRKAVQLDPAFAGAHSNIVMCLNYLQNRSPESVHAEHMEWARLHEKQDPGLLTHANVPDAGRRLRVAYVSPDFCAHSVAYFVGSILPNHDPASVETYCYADVAAPDSVTRFLQAQSRQWRDVCGMSDKSVCELIRNDRIDILVDLAGHTANNRLAVFAAKPAPVQVTYLGYPNTTGLRSMDYRITDSWADPPGASEAYHSETLVRLPDGFLCYQPPPTAKSVSPLPARKDGHLTFGSFNNLSKITEAVIELWAELLHAVPDARLLIKNKSLNDAQTRERYSELLRDRRIKPERFELLGSQPTLMEHLLIYDRVDIALDTFPYNGTTTTCEALWMGVPVITLAGQTHSGRVGVSLLSQVGLHQFIARDPAQYVAIARELFADHAQLEKIRASLRRSMEVSTLCDGKRFTHGLEQAYRQMWADWCQHRSDEISAKRD